jgi:hypothetical protein
MTNQDTTYNIKASHTETLFTQKYLQEKKFTYLNSSFS